jgi:hypothetical protein
LSLHHAIETRARAVPQNYWARLGLGVKARMWLSYRFVRLVMSLYRFDWLR